MNSPDWLERSLHWMRVEWMHMHTETHKQTLGSTVPTQSQKRTDDSKHLCTLLCVPLLYIPCFQPSSKPIRLLRYPLLAGL